MDTKKLTADYIFGIGEDSGNEVIDKRLQMALHVYEAMPTVRDYLIKDIFEAVGERIRVAEKLDEDQLDIYGERHIYFRTGKTGDFWIYAGLVEGKSPKLELWAGVYTDYESDAAQANRTQEEKIQASFEEKCDLGSWSDGNNQPVKSYIAYSCVLPKAGKAGGRWDGDDFLTRAVRHRDDVVENLESLLMRIYRGVFPLASD